MATLEELTRLVLRFRDERDWKQFHTPKDMVLSLMLEAGELAEHFQWMRDDEAGEYVKLHRDEVSEELADVLYWVLLIAADFDIPLQPAFERKMKLNEQKYPADQARGRSEKYDKL